MSVRCTLWLNVTLAVVCEVYDYNEINLQDKTQFLTSIYNADLKRYQSSSSRPSVDDFVDYQIKWSAGLKGSLTANKSINFDPSKTTKALYRPFIIKNFYFEPLLSDRLTKNHFNLESIIKILAS